MEPIRVRCSYQLLSETPTASLQNQRAGGRHLLIVCSDVIGFRVKAPSVVRFSAGFFRVFSRVLGESKGSWALPIV